MFKLPRSGHPRTVDVTIEQDVEALRAFITTHDNIPPVDAAFDRIVAYVEVAQETLKDRPIEGWRKLRDVRKEHDELRAALQEIQRIHIARGYCLWAQDIARSILQRTEEVKSPRA